MRNRYFCLFFVILPVVAIFTAAMLLADSTVIQPFTYSAPVQITVNLTPNMPITLPLMVGTTKCVVTVPAGQRVKLGEVEATGRVEVTAFPVTLDVFDADRVTVTVEESK